jgi:hypothetical protein
MANSRCALDALVEEKTNYYSIMMVLTTLTFLAFMVAGTAALQVKINAEAPAQDNPAVSSSIRNA